jgi:type III secretion protein Q
MTHTVPTGRPIVWPRLSRNEAAARGLLAQRVIDQNVMLADEPWALSLEPWPVGAALSRPDSNDWLVQCSWAGAPFVLCLPAHAGHAWIAARLPSLELPELSPQFAAAAVEHVLSDLATHLKGLRRGPAAIERIERGSDQTPLPAHSFGLTLRQKDTLIQGSLSTNNLGLMLMAGLVTELEPADNALADDSLPIALRAQIGSATITSQALGALAQGDTVLMHQAHLGQEQQFWLTQGPLSVLVQWHDMQLIVIKPLTATGFAMASESDTQPPNEEPLPIDQLPMRLTFDLGERTLSLGELRNLQVGQALELNRPLSGAVTIRANGAVIGTGELVEIDGRLGVTLASLARAAPSGDR